MTSDARRELLAYLDRTAFDPVLLADPSEYAAEERPLLEEARFATAAAKRRYHDPLASAEQLREAFRDDVASREGDRLRRELRILGLPALPDVRRGFEKLADRLGIGA